MGTRLREASEKLPNPLVGIGGRPVLWHIMKIYGDAGFRRFVLCLGYKGDQVNFRAGPYGTLRRARLVALAHRSARALSG